MNELSKDFLVIQDNALIEKKRCLSLDEQKVILIFASLIELNDEEFKTYKVEANKIMDLLEVKNQSKYTTLKETIYKLADKSLKFEDEKSFSILHWFDYAEYKNGVMQVEFNRRLKPYLLGLKEFFTKYKLENILHMKSKYSLQIYELLKSNEFKKMFILSIEEIRQFLNLQNKYTQYTDFKKNTILLAQKEINDKSDISFEFEEIKSGKKVSKIKFIVKAKKVGSISENETVEKATIEKNDDLILQGKVDMLKGVINGLEEKDYENLLKIADPTEIMNKYILLLQQGIKINNLMGILTDALKKDYKEPVNIHKSKTNKSTKFHNFEDRFEKYSEDELEKIVIEKQKKKFG